MAGVFPILFISSTRIGDAVLSSGLIRRLTDEIPNASFTIAAGPVAAPLFRDHPRLDKLIPLEKKKNGGHWFDLWRKTQGRRWGLIVDTRGSGLARFLSAKKRAIYARPAEDAPVVHKVIEAARLLKLEDDPPAPHLYTSAETEAAADALIGKSDAPILAIGAGANWIGKQWPSERFAETASRLLRPDGPLAGGRLLILGSEADWDASHTVRLAVERERTIDLTGRVDLLVAYACLKRARLFVGNDSGLMHLAAAAGAPTLGLFGPSDDRRYGPWGPDARALRGPRPFEDFLAVDPELNQAVRHMSDLRVDPVVRAATELLRQTER